MTADFEELLRFFKALANESRLKLLGLLARNEHSVQELAMLLDLKEPTVSHHLNMLRALGLARLRAEGNTHWYALDPDALTRLSRAVLSPERVIALADDVADGWEARVIGNLIGPDGRLKDIPASRKKRRVILAWLARQFDQGKNYHESDVNFLLQRHHWDSATLRRELIGYRMLIRNAGWYQRLPESNWQSA